MLKGNLKEVVSTAIVAVAILGGSLTFVAPAAAQEQAGQTMQSENKMNDPMMMKDNQNTMKDKKKKHTMSKKKKHGHKKSDKASKM